VTPIRFSPSSLREGHWFDYLTRFGLGGAATVFTGLISSRYGASVGGLFLALLAIFCASATLIEKHEIRRKRKAGFTGERRGQEAAALDAVGAGLGSFGMLTFAAVFSIFLESSVAGAFAGASLAWRIVSVGAWYVRRKLRRARQQKERAAPRLCRPVTTEGGAIFRMRLVRSSTRPRTAPPKPLCTCCYTPSISTNDGHRPRSRHQTCVGLDGLIYFW
jgi:hypothetical protein